MLSIERALDEALRSFTPLEAERVDLHEALGRYLAEALDARVDLPPFDASAMDGYAVRADDLRDACEARPVVLEVAGEVRAGTSVASPIERGTAARIFTGGMVPDGADAVVAQEDTERDGARVAVRAAPPLRQHVRPRGSDVRAGERLLEAGHRLDVGELAMLASQEIVRVSVHRRPTVAILATGDELRDPGELARPGTIVDSNALMIAAAVRAAGGIPRVLPRVADDPDALRDAFATASGADVVLSTGGVSVGDHDHVPRVLEALGATLRFAKVAMKPGKPVRIATLGRVPFVGLPGNPASALVGFELFVAPGLRVMQGSRAPYPRPTAYPLAASVRRRAGRAELARGRIVDTDRGPSVALASTQGSGALRSLESAEVLVHLPAEASELPEGTWVRTLPVGGPGRSARNPIATACHSCGPE